MIAAATQGTTRAVKAVKALGEGGGKINVASFDLSPGFLKDVENGDAAFAIDQQQYLQGYLGVLFAYLKVKYDLTPPPNPVSTGPAVIGKADVAGLKPLVEAGFR